MNNKTWQEKARLVEADPAASGWLQEAVKALLKRDPIDAANETEFLAGLMRQRLLEIMERVHR